MVMFPVNDGAGSYDLGAAPPVTKVVTQVASDGQTDYFFTSTTIYNASMFALRDPSHDWLGTLFFGRSTIGPDGMIGFIPNAQIGGIVGGVSADAFALRSVTNHRSNDGLQLALFAGNDTLIGSSRGNALEGEAGDDVIIAHGPSIIDGGTDDDDVLTPALHRRGPRRAARHSPSAAGPRTRSRAKHGPARPGRTPTARSAAARFAHAVENRPDPLGSRFNFLTSQSPLAW